MCAIQLVTVSDYTELSTEAAGWLTRHVRANPTSLIVLPTGNTPLGMYDVLAKQANRATLFGSCRLIQLDEYLGIACDDPRNLFGWLNSEFLEPVGFPVDRAIRFNSETSEPEREALRIDTVVSSSSGVDLLVLGLGPNGHLGFNEPGSSFDSPTRVVELTKESVVSNAQYWGSIEYVPRRAFTLGLKTLATARHSLLLVSGGHKAEILAQTLEEAVTEEVPATLLRRMRNVTIIADGAAASRLALSTLGRLL